MERVLILKPDEPEQMYGYYEKRLSGHRG